MKPCKPANFARNDRVIWQLVETGIPVISRVMRVGFQGIWVRTGKQTYYIHRDMVMVYRKASAK